MGRDGLERKSPAEEKSTSWFEQAGRVIPGGVNSPVRAFKGVGGTPRFMVRGHGSRVWDEDGGEYIDYLGSWGALILGHAHPEVIRAARSALENGLSFGTATSREVELAEMLHQAIPGLEKIRLVTSGTEATMTALRLARASSGKSKILKFEGCYHGHADSFLVKAGSGLLTFGNPSSAGVPEAVVKDTLVAAYNHGEALEAAFEQYGKDLACVIVEPVAANMGVVLPKPDFLKQLKTLCEKHRVLLIFDEVITGFRIHFGGYQELCGIRPDLTCLGKIIGGGLPLAAVGGRNEILSLLAPEGPVYQAGTLSGNPVATASGLATLRWLKENKPYENLARLTDQLCQGIEAAAREFDLPVAVNHLGSMLTLFFGPQHVGSFEDVMASSAETYKEFFHAMLGRGVYLPPSAYEAWFVSVAHSEDDIRQTVSRIRDAFSGLKISFPSRVSRVD